MTKKEGLESVFYRKCEQAMPRGSRGIAKVKVLRGILKGALFQKRPLEPPKANFRHSGVFCCLATKPNVCYKRIGQSY